MGKQQAIPGRYALTLVAALAWFGVLLQLGLSIRLSLDNGKTVLDGLVVFLGYFTVLTNLFVALVSSVPLVFGHTRWGRRLGKGTVLGCATTGILLVGIAYHLLLRNVWAPEGLQWVADMVLHYLVPAALSLYWLLYATRQDLTPWSPLVWSLYPALYLAYALGRGELLDVYPYPFIDVAHIGYPQVLINASGLMVAYVVLGSLVYAIAVFRPRTGAIADQDG